MTIWSKNDLVQFPQVVISIVPVVNLPGIAAGQLVIDGPTLANIYLGNITKWNDPALKALNPKVDLPDMAIVVVHRSDGSGTTFNFTNYLGKVSPEWLKQCRLRHFGVLAGRAWAARAMKAWRRTCSRRRAPSAMSNMPMPRRTT